ncbi:hypothetical protein ACUN7V_08580 [Quadrisphaera oryzae]|uniref:hypothetical protein n=1 Tax=Quadrisphaera TaxID=317661 RepID=UPI0016479034|nr:hypothetical protein [Quadrisphaera sp. RL12-1S]MBC3763794.1 hypothetical protein [Quadrisphaera sp. RL12-1S]
MAALSLLETRNAKVDTPWAGGAQQPRGTATTIKHLRATRVHRTQPSWRVDV